MRIVRSSDYRAGHAWGAGQMVTLRAGDIFVADEGDAHAAHPRGQARLLVIERAGSP